MAKPLPKIRLAPGVLSWAREAAGWSLEEAARKVEAGNDQLRAWEIGAAEVPLTLLEQLADLYRRPVAVMFLPRPPSTPNPPSDFRSLPTGSSGFSKETSLSIRRARRLRGLAAQLIADVGDVPESDFGAAVLEDDPEEVAVRERRRLRVSLENQRGWRNERDALQGWRDALEHLSILTFQFPMPVGDARGFSLADGGIPAIVISSDDAHHARIFTLMHEYGHVILRTTGVCLPGEEAATPSSMRVERWCDRFAGAVLMPQDALARDKHYHAYLAGEGNTGIRLAHLSSAFKVSRHALLTRFLTLDAISHTRYKHDTSELFSKPKPKGGGPVRPAVRCVNQRGRAFTRLVVRGLDRDLLNYADVADYLGIRIKHLDQVRELLGA